MSYEKLKTRLEWFVEEKGNLEDAEAAVRDVRAETVAIQFNVPPSGNLTGVKAAYDDLRSAILDETEVSLNAGGDLLDSMAEAISQTGRNYLRMESANTEYAIAISLLIHQSGL